MNNRQVLEPLPQKHRSYFFYSLVAFFVVTLPFLFLYATGYSFNFGENTIVRTGGLYVSGDRTGAEIYIDNELVRETRTFRTAFYAQNITPGTHRVHVQKPEHHTWVKELPVYSHLVTEAQAFNMPLNTSVRVVSTLRTPTGAMVIEEPLLFASTSNSVVFKKDLSTTTIPVQNAEYDLLLEFFNATSSDESDLLNRVVDSFASEPSAVTEQAIEEVSENIKIKSGVELYELEDSLFASYNGPRNDMPYYYCAETFPLLQNGPVLVDQAQSGLLVNAVRQTEDQLPPIQSVSEESICDPTIAITTNGKDILAFDFYPGSSDLVVVLLSDGLYVTEIDDRAWQNSQLLLTGTFEDMRVIDGNVYVYDGTLIYDVELSG